MATTFNSISAICLVIISVMLLIYIPFLFHSIHQFRLTYKTNNFLRMRTRHRRPLLVFIMNIICSFIMVIEQPLLACKFIFGLFKLNVWIMQLLYMLSYVALFICLSFKTYLIYYNEQLHESLEDQPWREKINRTVTDWYIANRVTWGNPIWLMKIFFIPFILIVALIQIVYFFSGM